MAENVTTERKSFAQRLLRITASDVVRLIFLCVLVGFILAAFHIDPGRLWIDFFGTLGEAWGRFLTFITGSAGWAVQYFLLGAIIVVPIWLLVRFFRAMGRN